MKSPTWLKAILACMALVYLLDFAIFKEGLHAALASAGFLILFLSSFGAIRKNSEGRTNYRDFSTMVFFAGAILVIASFWLKWKLPI